METIAKLRKVGGSTTLTIPRGIGQELGLKPDSTVGLIVEDGALVIRPKAGRGRIGLKARLAMCDFTKPRTKEEREWIDAPRVGNEEI